MKQLAAAIREYGATGKIEAALNEAVTLFDWQDKEEAIIRDVAYRLDEDGKRKLSGAWRGGSFFIMLDGETHRPPLTMSRHDSYVMLSSLAVLLGDEFEFLLLRRSIEEERHMLLVLTKAQARLLRARLDADFTPLLTRMKLGFDYFFSIDIPYLRHEDNNPLFKEQCDEITHQIEAARKQAGLDPGLSTTPTIPTDQPWWKFWRSLWP